MAGLLVLSVSMPGFAQSNVDDISDLKSRIDSLTTIKLELKRQLDDVTIQIEKSKERLRRREYEASEPAELVLITNMEASLRSHPSPGARVVRLVPENTPLIALDFEDAYWKVRHEDLEGWIMRMFVDEGEKAGAFRERMADASSHEDGSDSWLKPRNHRAERMGKDMLITAFGMHPPNSAGGVSIYYAFEHLDSTRTIREITFSITPYNEEGLIEKGKNSGVATRRLRRFGPIGVHDGERQYQFENVWYNERIHCIQIDRIDVVFTDGSRSSHSRSIPDLLSQGLDNDCLVHPADSTDTGDEEQ